MQDQGTRADLDEVSVGEPPTIASRFASNSAGSAVFVMLPVATTSSEQIVTIEIRVVVEHLVDRHARGQQLQEVLDRIAQTPHRRLTVADRRV